MTLNEAASDLYKALVSEHGHDEKGDAPWPACLPVHIAMNRYQDSLAASEDRAEGLDVERLTRALWAERAGTTPHPGGANWAEQMDRATRLVALYDHADNGGTA